MSLAKLYSLSSPFWTLKYGCLMKTRISLIPRTKAPRKVQSTLRCLLHMFKVPLLSNSRYSFFFIFFPHSRPFLDILSNFSLLRTLKSSFFGLYFREFSAAINFPCSNSSLRIGVNDVIFSKIRH